MDKRVASYIEAEYIHIELLKKTELSNIWLSKDGTGQIVVVKHLSTTGLPFRKLKEIAHPLWPRILFTAEEDGKTWVVEEYVSGNTLSAGIEVGRRFSPAEVKSIMLQLLDGMAAFHQAGVTMKELLEEEYHGWLKPVLDKCTALDPKHRYQNANELREALLYPSHNRPSRIAALFPAACVILVTGYWMQQQKLPTESREEQKTPPAHVEAPLKEANPGNAPVSPNSPNMEGAPATEENVHIIPQGQVFSPDSSASPRLDSSSVHTVPQPLPEMTKETAKLSSEDIVLSLTVGNENLGMGGKYNITVPKAEWEAWETAGTTPMMTKYFPSGWEIVLTIENRGSIPIEKCTLQSHTYSRLDFRYASKAF